jgi:hypothetical protein
MESYRVFQYANEFVEQFFFAITLIFWQGDVKNGKSAGLHKVKQGSSQSTQRAGIFEQTLILHKWSSHSMSDDFDSNNDNAIS